MKQNGAINTSTDVCGLSEYLNNGYNSGERTIYRGINKLLPGNVIVYSHKSNSIKVSRFWDLAAVKRKEVEVNDKFNQEKELYALLQRSVHEQLEADHDVAILLSGGLDSSLITAIASESKRVMVTLTFKDNSNYDESQYAKKQKSVNDHTEVPFIIPASGK